MSAAGVDVYTSTTGGSFGNVVTCGSVWHCPVCAARITEKRRQELQAAVNMWTKRGGTEVYFMTLTFPHLDHQRLDENISLFSAALKLFKNCKTYKRIMKSIGGAGSIRALEVTHGANGWHPHTHDLVFADAGHMDKLQALQLVWIEVLIKVGLAERCQMSDMLKVAFDIQNGDYAAEYIAKFGHEPAKATLQRTGNTWGVSHEMTKAHAKVGKRLGGRTPFTLIADFIEGDEESGELFKDFAKQFKGKRQLFWSPKLRVALRIVDWSEGKSKEATEAVGIEFDRKGRPVVGYEKEKADMVLKTIGSLPVEKSDEELAAEPEELPDRVYVTTLNHEEWKLVLSRNARFKVLEVAEREGAEGVARLLVELAGRKRTHSGIYSERGTYSGNWHRLDA